MPKDKTVRSFSFDRSRASPYPCSSKNAQQSKSKNHFEPAGDEREWEEARCSICMEHPHNAVLLLCSSHDKGCRPYMCNTSYRHSNCLDQYHKSFAATPSRALPREVTLSSTAHHRSSEEWRMPGPSRSCGSQLQPKLVCPLCRGHISGWVVIEPARRFMNSKPRSCSCETCDFSGTYSELRKHARLEHPSVRPSDVDPTRQHDWIRSEHERDFEDVLSTVQSVFGDEEIRDSILLLDYEYWLTFSFLTMFEAWLAARRSGSPTGRGQLHNTRSARTSGSYDMASPATRRSSNNVSSESVPGFRQQRWQNRRRST